MILKAVKFFEKGFYAQGFVFGGEDGAEHDGVAFEDLPDDWTCPRCKQSKDKFGKA